MFKENSFIGYHTSHHKSQSMTVILLYIVICKII